MEDYLKSLIIPILKKAAAKKCEETKINIGIKNNHQKRIRKYKQTFMTFVDINKAFDYVD